MGAGAAEVNSEVNEYSLCTEVPVTWSFTYYSFLFQKELCVFLYMVICISWQQWQTGYIWELLNAVWRKKKFSTLQLSIIICN